MEPLNPAKRAGQGPTLIDLIQNAAESTSQSIIAYGAEETVGDLVPTVVSYSDLLCLARTTAQVLLRLCLPSVGIGGEHHVDLLCLDNILDTIIWFWSTVIAGLLPAISTTSILEPGRSEYLSYLRIILLKDPLCIVSQSLSSSYCLQDFPKKLSVAETTSQSLARMSRSMPLLPLPDSSSASDPAVLMLTSEGKAKSAGPHSGGPYLNWIIMDHVACLIENHLLAMYMGFSQVHLSADEVLSNPVQLLNMLKNPTPRRLAMIIEGSERKNEAGSPVVTLRSKGRKTPLWLVHPGVREILVLTNLMRLIDDRPVYAFRAVGLDSGVSPFDSLDELLDYYFQHCKAVEAKGPYAIAGHPFGSMIAFELCKRLETAGDEVLDCGCWNLPPHTKHRMRQFGWVECLANLFHFTQLIEQDQALQQIPMLRTFSKQEAVAHLRALSDSDRWLDIWLETTSHGERYAAWMYLSQILLKEVAIDRKDWVLNKLSRWREFVSDVQCYDVPGEHYSMLDEVNVSRFAEKLQEVLEAREGPLRRTLQ
ncbi:hypothetical protein CMEL01_09799 [Colletotrichum melonis]|uniref:Thioesterase domain-containing protein n=1 Tax=Colletotrichum melonis TaxID=1209925 RepID=A0AAI9TU32_9PEZI|nr:hypothetical protein CMEL01_09799 [Colletotrichum melonis]